MTEQNYDFRSRHWHVHQPHRRRRMPGPEEICLTRDWTLGYTADADPVLIRAVEDFQDYLLESMELQVKIVQIRRPQVLWIEIDPSLKEGFQLEVSDETAVLSLAKSKTAWQALIHLEDIMNLEGAPVLPRGCTRRRSLYRCRCIHSGSGIDFYPDQELRAALHAGYDSIALFVKDFDRNAVGSCDINDLIRRCDAFGMDVYLYNYIRSYIHPDDPEAEARFDSVYGELFRRYPGAAGIMLCGESLEFPSRDPHTSGKPYEASITDGIPDTRPSPGWYPCQDYPDYLAAIEKVIHRVKPSAEIMFSTYNWGYAPLELRKNFLQHFPKNLTVKVCYEIFSRRELEGLQTPVMDYTCSAADPSYYFESECRTAHELGISIQGNVNTAGIAWDFGCVPYVPAPGKWLQRDRNLRKARTDWGVDSHYVTHHYGWWNCIAADLGKWSSWQDFEPDYSQLMQRIAVRDYGDAAAPHVLKAWQYWTEAMDHYIASNEDQYGPWRVGAAYPFIFQPNISRTMMDKEIAFPTDPDAHFGNLIIKTFYHPYENTEQSPGFLRYPAEIRSLEIMLKLWNQGLEEARNAVTAAADEYQAENQRLEALGHFIRNSIITVIHIKQWWIANMAMQSSPDAETAEKELDKIEQIARLEIDNARDTVPAVQCDSRIGWEPSMEYVCDTWHLQWKIRQVESALREISAYRRMLHLSSSSNRRTV